MKIEISPELSDAVQFGVIEAEDVVVGETPDKFRQVLKDLAAEYAEEYRDIPPGQVETIREVRSLFHRTGLDPTRHRPSSEALFRRVVRGKELYFINTAVDLINYFSLKWMIPMGLFDSDTLRPPIEFRVGREGETYEGIGRGELNLYHFPVLSDQAGAFGSPISDSVRTRVQDDTRNLLWVLIAPPSTVLPMEEAAAAMVEWNGGHIKTVRLLAGDGTKRS
jgi:DNA/RNA-binding domain of Phe-tRNA-synthetase-like protein